MSRIVKPTLTTFAALVVGLVSLPAPAHAQTTLSMKYQEGKVLNYETVQSTTSKAMVNGQKFDTTMKQTMNLSMKVVDVDSEGVASVEQSIERIRMEMELPPPVSQKISYDSDNPGESAGPFAAMTKSYEAMKGATFKMKIDPKGDITDIEVPEALINATKNSPLGMQGMGGKDAMKQMMTQGNINFPSKPVAKGDSWNSENEIKLPFGTMKTEITYTYAGQQASGLHKIDGVMKLSIEKDDENSSPVQLDIKDSEGKGVFLFDNEKGHLAETKFDQSMKMVMSVGGQNIEQSITTNLEMSLKD